MSKRTIKYAIDSKLNKKFKNMLKLDGINKSKFLEKCINEYIDRKNPTILDIDSIMDKMMKYGIDSLTKEEREFMDNQCE